MAEKLHIVELAERSDTGRVRDHNEDRSYVAAHIVAVADGMGGALAGEVASQMAVEAIEGVSKPADPLSIKAAIENANRAIRRMAAQDPGKSGMGTTITAATVDGQRVDVVHVGDSRAYLWRGDDLVQITHDHSVVAELVRQGTLSPEEAVNHPHRNVITRALGAEPEVTVDMYQHDVEPDDILLLCSDGLYGEVTDDEIVTELRQATSMEEAAAALVARANANGGSDNVTVVLARVGEGAPTQATSATLSSDTQEIPVENEPAIPRGGRPDRTTKVIGGVPAGGADSVSTTPLVLERAPGVRRRRPGLWILGILVLLGALAASFSWFQNRSYSLTAGDGGTVWVERGITLGPLDTTRNWEDTGVPASAAGTDLGGIGGEGETVLRASRLVWQRGLPDVAAPTPQGPETQVPGVGPLTRGTSTAPAPTNTTTSGG